jgi:hypothetical protein
MAITYEPIATTTLGSATTVTFSSIPATYTDLVLVVNGSTTRATTSDTIRIQFNGDTGSNYSSTNLVGNGSAASSNRYSNETMPFVDGIRLTGTDFPLASMIIYQVMNYSNTTTYKTILARGSAADFNVCAAVGLWRSTSAINSIYLQGDTVANFAIGTTFSLYGIASA